MTRIIDACSTRPALGTFMTLLLITCIIAGSNVQSTVTQLRQTAEILKERQLRNGYVAISDIQRLNLIVQQAVLLNIPPDDVIADFRVAADMLFVRADHFACVAMEGQPLASANDAIARLEQVLAIADQGLATDLADIKELATQLPVVSETARQALVSYLDDMRRKMDRLLDAQTLAMTKQKTVVWGALAALSIFGTTALLLLRREVISRQAKQRAEVRVRQLAYFDPLTNLPNRLQYQEKLTELLGAAAGATLMLIDLDQFKTINDTYGQDAGDAVIRRIGARLGFVAETHDAFPARLGGDEFAVLLAGTDLAAAKTLGDALIARGRQPFILSEGPIEATISIGLATTNSLPPGMHCDGDGLSRLTDFALRASKTNGRNQLTVYDSSLEKLFLEHRRMVEELPLSLKNGDMEFFLQPKIDMGSGHIYGFEALARWRRNGAIVPPDTFIPTAEDSGLITEIDRTLARRVCHAIAAHNCAKQGDFSVSVNFSALHFNSLTFVDFIDQTLKESRLQPHLLTLEITETAELRDLAKAKTVMRGIHDLGVRIAIDDFGAGFSSLAYLRSTIADELKIDRSLVVDVETSSASRFLLKSIIGIAKRMEFDVVVEGIETKEQADLILAAGANAAQGYLFGRPQPHEQALTDACAHNANLIEPRTAEFS